MNWMVLKREFILTARDALDILRDEANGIFNPTPWKDRRQAKWYMRAQFIRTFQA